MATTTIGQRIAERRKMLNLSQEAFGEKMGVSRQAISKWEADAAMPEIDKLIAMSKLFSVSVGWLLGTEEETTVPNTNEGFSEDQLKMVEEIVKRYQQPPQKQQDMIPVVIIGALFLLSVGIVVSMFFGSYVNQEMGAIQSQLSQLYSYYASIQSQLSSVSESINDLAEGEKLLSQYTLEAEAWEDMAGATVRFTAIPNATQAGDQAWLSVRLDGEEVANQMCTMDGSAYTASIDLPAANGYSYYFQVVHTGGDSSQQPLMDENYVCDDLERALRGSVYANVGAWDWEDNTLHLEMEVYRSDPYLLIDDTAEWAQFDLVLLRNGREIDRISLLDQMDIDAWFVYECPLEDLTAEDELLLRLEHRYTSTSPVTNQPAVLLYLNNGELDAMQYAVSEK